MGYIIKISQRCLKDFSKLKRAGFLDKVQALISVLEENPYENPPPYKKLVGDLKDYYSRRVNIQHRLIYRVDEENKTLYVRRAWTRYE
ncbi:Txe/YoeB family addiction module toxin [Sporosarcina limicola]|uniref:Endoribonuclease YoeB n=1 Tax=Sporosarcina limicola TaxID=34101 RepID=A0A927MPY4_9BACL|nr:Txe/YoeB family addiction module toxin [Sporosarcina limicola]MBE1555221.1 Txe/YoeB family toxin of toxin-antitoxin system [Sporosarcina limicola]